MTVAMKKPVAEISINGERLIADKLGALYWPAREMLIVSDLHFEKGSSFAGRGIMLPPYDTRSTLMRLEKLIRTYQPSHVLSLGDAFHDRGAETRMDDEDASRLEALTRNANWLWVLGNHDPAPPTRFGGAANVEFRFDKLIFRHEPAQSDYGGEIAGHLHPCARIAAEGRVIRRRCFVVDADQRLIMPAIGAYTGGLNILDQAYAGILKAPTAWVMGTEGVYPISAEYLVPEPGAEEPAKLTMRQG